jgi:hypothetical protein
MDCLQLDNLLGREKIKEEIIELLNECNSDSKKVKRGFYIYGNSGSGKTEFVMRLLKSLNYDVIYYDASEIRNKNMIETIANNSLGNKNIISMFHKKIKKIAIVMDELEGISSSDKGGMAALIKLMRPKKTKKQQTEEFSKNPIFCIGNYHVDKKIKEMMKIANNFELKKPSEKQLHAIVKIIMPKIENELIPNMLNFIDGDLRKLNSCFQIYKKQHHILKNEMLTNIFQTKVNNDYTKDTVRKLMNNNINIHEHDFIMNETDRTIISLLYHENIIDGIKQNVLNLGEKTSQYYDFLKNYTFCDYMDRVTFQKQIWIYNEMSSLLKIIQNNNTYHKNNKNIKGYNPKEVRFTKILTKYSTEYNNILFINDLCQKLNMDKKDMLSYFLELRNSMDEEEIIHTLANYEIQKLDIHRIFRYIDKYTLEE